jgi:ferredoxin--NADP+ reductase
VLKEIITKITHWSDRTFSFRCTRSDTFRFNSGEFAMIGLRINEKNCIRAYSVVSPPWADYLEFLSIKNVGPLTNELSQIKEGDSLLILPKCTGTLRNDFLTDGGNRLVLLATGTGLAPFMSTVRDLDVLERFDCIQVIHSVRNRNDLAYFEELQTNFKDAEPELYDLINSKLSYIPLVTSEGDKRIDARFLQQSDRVMACGNLQFNYDVMDWCANLGMREGSNREQGEFVIEKAFVDFNTF